LSLINEVIKKDALILDCGSGKRNFIHKNLIQSEVVPYDNVDVLATNQKLPFKNNSFDLIISLDVLEHVTDPIKSSSELSRCLKNGGLLLVDIPFLQAEHGYPDHYFNASRSGMKILFKELKSIIHLVPPSGHPFHVIWSILRAYKNSLPPDLRQSFEKLSIGEILGKPWEYFRDHSLGQNISQEGKWILASTTQAIFRKPGKIDNNKYISSAFLKSLPVYKNN